ncbi:MAG: D-alanyl-D-alanine carboxypeptidase/D-alanyl-D-alanine-endopeptidase [Betaproteobacteria bacterium]|nr:MAG: D-alanyl-D-alanine carboxypeptidase/D-alanyl-D-alanine-endopeptidase [Betaproteobacteria bacterium]
MRKPLICLLAGGSLLTASLALAATTLPPAPVANALARAGVPDAAFGIHVYNLSDDELLLEVAGDTPFNPASVMKLITTFAALDVLSPAYTWKTEALIDGPLFDGRLTGNLYFRGHGDPSLTLERFWLFLRELRNRGVRDISGNVYLDRSAFAIGAHDPAEFDGEPTRPYNVGADALLLNYKTVLLRFVPDEANGRIDILSDPLLPGINIINNLALGKGHCDYWPRTPTQNGNTLAFTGVFPSGCGEKSRYYSLLEPDAYFSAVFRQLWAELGGTLSGSVEAGTVPRDARLIASRESAPLAEVVRETNKFSNNVMARHLFLSLGSEQGYPLTTNKARSILDAWLASRRFDFSGLEVDNGSGLSRSSRLTPRQLGQVLIEAWRSPLMPELVASLPLVAVDGTMKKRLDESPVAGRAHVKTGYLEGVRSIAGYVNNARGQTLSVVFFVNHDRSRYAGPALDALLEWAHGAANEPSTQLRNVGR